MNSWPQRVELVLPGDDTWLPAVRTFLTSLFESFPGDPVEPATVAELELVLQEACVNAIRHSGVNGTYRVVFLIAPDELTIEVRDRGLGFEPDSIPEPSPDELRTDGYGVYIMKRSMDRVDARRVDGEFVLTLTRRLSRSGAAVERSVR